MGNFFYGLLMGISVGMLSMRACHQDDYKTLQNAGLITRCVKMQGEDICERVCPTVIPLQEVCQ
jgi:hypothetical protein